MKNTGLTSEPKRINTEGKLGSEEGQKRGFRRIAFFTFNVVSIGFIGIKLLQIEISMTNQTNTFIEVSKTFNSLSADVNYVSNFITVIQEKAEGKFEPDKKILERFAEALVQAVADFLKDRETNTVPKLTTPTTDANMPGAVPSPETEPYKPSKTLGVNAGEHTTTTADSLSEKGLQSGGENTTTMDDGQSRQLLSVAEDNAALKLDPIGDKQVEAGAPLTFTIKATASDNDVINYSVQGLPDGATFEDQVFTWTPRYEQGGTYKVTFTATCGRAQGSETITITVANTASNRPPVLEAMPPTNTPSVP